MQRQARGGWSHIFPEKIDVWGCILNKLGEPAREGSRQPVHRDLLHLPEGVSTPGTVAVLSPLRSSSGAASSVVYLLLSLLLTFSSQRDCCLLLCPFNRSFISYGACQISPLVLQSYMLWPSGIWWRFLVYLQSVSGTVINIADTCKCLLDKWTNNCMTK